MSKKSIQVLASTGATIVVLGVLALFVWQVVWPAIQDMPFMDIFDPDRNIVDFHEHHNLDPNVPIIIFDGDRVRDVTPVVEFSGDNATVFLPETLIRELVDPFLFWDEGAEVFFISSRYEMLEFTPGSSTFLLNDTSTQLSTPIRRDRGEVYLPADLLTGLYPWLIDFRPTTNVVMITDASVEQTTAEVIVSHATIRFFSTPRAPIAARLPEGTVLYVFTDEDNLPPDGFVRVRTPDGIVGYAEPGDLSPFVTGVPSLGRQPMLREWLLNFTNHPPNFPPEKRINMVWEAMETFGGNTTRMDNGPFHDSVNVVSPQWFRIDETGSFMDSIASMEYVDWAQSQGALVWPKVFDENHVRVSRFLPNREARRVAINQLINYADALNLDGLNIDFEHLSPAEAPYKIQFLRELAIPMRERGLVLSAAVLVPIPNYNMFYRRDLIGLTVDFVMVMTYDEHWATAPTAVPNASLPWVQRAIENMLREVPNEKLVLGLPFYVRKWREVVRDGALTSRAVSMNYARNFFEERNVDWEWNSEIGSYFGEVAVTEDNEAVIWRTWLECERSIRAKMQFFVAYDLAGVAAWRRLLENEETQIVIGSFFE